jgi:type I restriction-modification system DNA methylase subunit
MGLNERKTEDMVERRLRTLGYHAADSGITVEKQHSDTPRINKLLEHASKSGGGVGKPEFIIQHDKVSDFIIIIECKADPAKHESASRTKYSEFAVDGVLLYASCLSKDLDVLAIAVSGQNEASFRISHFLQLRGSLKAEAWNAARDIVSFDDYYQAFITSDIKFRQDYEALLDYSRTLNHELQSKKITEAQRGFLISGILIALKNRAFRQSYVSHQTAKQLKTNLLETINAEFENAKIPTDRREMLAQAFSFIKPLPADKEFIVTLIEGIDKNINTFMKTHKYYDTIGRFYIEFLRYANNDKGLGIVLTPHHIAGLFAMLADVNKDSVVFDNCCGTAGLLIAAMEQMVTDAGADNTLKKKIKKQQLFGIEYQPSVYALAVCNMILHDDGKTNVHRGDCFENASNIFQITDESGKNPTDMTPTVGILNPPYKNKNMPNDPEELAFVLNNLEYLAPGGRCVAIVPITCATNPGDILKQRLLEKHTLEAVMSMPIELFHNSKTNVVTCVMVFTAHRPHPRGKKTWFGYWRDDGLVKTKNRGRIDANGMWPLIRDSWVQAFRNREIVSGLSVMREVGAGDEWCAEAYLATDYDAIDMTMLFASSRRYVISQVMNQTAGSV